MMRKNLKRKETLNSQKTGKRSQKSQRSSPGIQNWMSVSPDPLAAASGSIYVPEEKKQIVTASGKVIEAETDLLKKKLESTRAAEAAASVPKGRSFYGTSIFQ